MRIIHYIAYLAPSDGHVAYCLRLAGEQQGMGHECEIVTGGICAGFEVAANLRDHVQSIGARGVRLCGHCLDANYARRLRGAFASLAPDVVHVHGFWSPNVAAAIRSARGRWPVVVSPHGALGAWVGRQRSWRKWVFGRLRWRCYHRDVGVYLAASASEAEGLRRSGFANVSVVAIGVDLPELRTDVTEPLRPVVLYLSRLHPQKGLHNWVRAWARVRPAGWRMRVVGGLAGAYAASVRALVHELDLDAVFSFEEAVTGEARTAAYREAGLFVLPSLTENFGMVVSEALACARPVITTTATPWVELPARGCGWCVEPTVEALAEALRQAVALPEGRRREMGLRGRDWMAQAFQWRLCASHVLEAYDAVIRQRSGNTHERGGQSLPA